jgi:dTMP kinase
MAGLFITLEGGEGAGKTTLAHSLAAALAADGAAVTVTREPGGTEGALAIRALMVSGDAQRWSPLSEALLVTAARNDHLERLIRPALARGEIVICDRFRDSTRAYQVAARGLPAAREAALSALIDAPEPDLTLLLDVPPDQGVARSRGAAAGEARFEGMALNFHETVRAAFLALARAEPQRFVVLDARAPADTVLAGALAAVRGRLAARSVAHE